MSTIKEVKLSDVVVEQACQLFTMGKDLGSANEVNKEMNWLLCRIRSVVGQCPDDQLVEKISLAVKAAGEPRSICVETYKETLKEMEKKERRKTKNKKAVAPTQQKTQKTKSGSRRPKKS